MSGVLLKPRATIKALRSWPRTLGKLLLGLAVIWFSFLASSPSTAEPLVLRIGFHEPMDLTDPLVGELHLRPSTPGFEDQEPLPIQAPGEVQVDLPEGSRWTVEVDIPDFWMPPQEISVTKDLDPIEIELWQAARLQAELLLNEEPPAEVEVRISPLEESEEWTISCAVTDKRLDCPIPSLLLDLRLTAEGFVPHYSWNQEVRWREIKDLGQLRLKRGASLIGWVLLNDPTHDPSRSTIELRPRLLGTSEEGRRRVPGTIFEVSADEHGFFQLVGVPLGSYRLRARHPTHAHFERGDVAVNTPEEVDLGVLELHPSSSLQIQIEPVTDPYHKPWTLALYRPMDRDPNYWTAVLERATDEQGSLRLESLEFPAYDLRIRDSRGAVWRRERIELFQREERLDFEIPLLRLELRLSLAEEPVSHAHLDLHHLSSGSRIQRQTNEDGIARVFLPNVNPWKVEIRKETEGILTHLPQMQLPSPEEGEPWARKHIELPATHLFGRVVAPEGFSHPNLARIDFYLENEGLTQGFAQDGGRFERRGFAPGTVGLEAVLDLPDGSVLRSGRKQIVVMEGEPVGPVDLVLERQQRIQGQLVAPGGQGIPGAKVFLLPNLGEVFTNTEGVFDLSVPDLPQLRLLVFAPGFAASAFTLESPFDSSPILPLHTVGGTLIVHYSELSTSEQNGHGVPPEITDTMVWRNAGPFASGSRLLYWARQNGVGPQQPGLLQVPQLEPGQYTVCHAPGISRFAMPTPPTEATCMSGYLNAGDALELQLPIDP